MAPLVSVLLPTRNRLDYLKLALQTVLRQDDGDWEVAEESSSSHRSHASGLVAAHLQWHLERQLRTLPLVERVYRQPADHGKEMFRQDVPHGDGPGDQLVAGG